MVLTNDAHDLGWRRVCHPWASTYANESVWLCPECVQRFKSYLMNERENALDDATRNQHLAEERLQRQLADLRLTHTRWVQKIREKYSELLEELS